MAGILFSLIVIGAESVIAQTLLVRELLVVFSGNELTIGIIIAHWVLLFAAGSYVSGRIADKAEAGPELLAVFQIAGAAVMPLSVFAARNLKNIFGIVPGQVPGLGSAFYMALVPVAPAAFCLGLMFVLSARMYCGRMGSAPAAAGRSYSFEALGNLAGGMIFTYVLITRFNSFDIMLASSVLLAVSANFLLRGNRIKTLRVTAVFSLAAFSLAFFAGAGGIFERSTLRTEWKNYDIVLSRNSVYGNIAVVKRDAQYTLFSNGLPAINIPVPDTVYTEEFAHITLLHHAAPGDILLVGGGAGGLLGELLKHPLKKITYVEIDPAVISSIRQFHSDLLERELNDPRVRLVYNDARRFITVSSDSYDAVLLNLDGPASIGINRYYTVEFFLLVEKRLKEGGIFALSLPCSLTYLNDELKLLNKSIIRSLESVFGEVKIIPGENKCFYICSLLPSGLAELDSSALGRRFAGLGIKTKLLTQGYIGYRFDKRWLEWFECSLAESVPALTNRDFRPAGLFYSLNYLNSIFQPGLAKLFNFLSGISLRRIFVFLAVFFSAVFFIAFKREQKSRLSLAGGLIAFSTGLAGMGFMIMLVLAFQSCYGYLYYKMGFLVSFFMAGLAAGSFAAARYLGNFAGKNLPRLLYKMELVIALFAAAFPFAVTACGNEPLFYLLVFSGGVTVGMEFPVLNGIYLSLGLKPSRALGTLYSLDLLGAWSGALAVSLWFLPLYGLAGCCLFLLLLKLFSSSLLLLK